MKKLGKKISTLGLGCLVGLLGLGNLASASEAPLITASDFAYKFSASTKKCVPIAAADSNKIMMVLNAGKYNYSLEKFSFGKEIRILEKDTLSVVAKYYDTLNVCYYKNPTEDPNADYDVPAGKANVR